VERVFRRWATTLKDIKSTNICKFNIEAQKDTRYENMPNAIPDLIQPLYRDISRHQQTYISDVQM